MQTVTPEKWITPISISPERIVIRQADLPQTSSIPWISMKQKWKHLVLPIEAPDAWQGDACLPFPEYVQAILRGQSNAESKLNRLWPDVLGYIPAPPNDDNHIREPMQIIGARRVVIDGQTFSGQFQALDLPLVGESAGYLAQGQLRWAETRHARAALELIDCDNVTIRGCTFQNIFGGGIGLRNCRHVTIDDGKFKDIGFNGLTVEHWGDEYWRRAASVQSEDIIIRNCTFDRCAQALWSACAIHAGAAANVVIEDCRISDMPGVGIHLGWYGGSETLTHQRGHVVRGCLLAECCRKLVDVGAIYAGGARLPNSVIENNRIWGIVKTPDTAFPGQVVAGIYVDRTNGVAVKGNRVIGGEPPYWLWHAGQGDMRYEPEK